jgi:hypothetical protein
LKEERRSSAFQSAICNLKSAIKWEVAMRQLLIALALTLPAGGARALAQAPRVAPPAELKKLHVLMAFDTKDERLEPSLAVDEQRMTRLWANAIPKERYSLTVLRGDKVTPQAILGHFRKLKLGPSEGALFFYGGHGAIDPAKGHYLQLASGKPLLRSELRKAMEATRAGLVVLVTDCCSTPIRLKTTRDRGITKLDEPKRLHPTVRCLLFQARGTVDVTAATNNAAWSDNERGGLFTRAVASLLIAPVKSLDTNKDGFVTWREFFPKLQRETEALFDRWLREMRSYKVTITGTNQKPYAYALGKRLLPTARSYAVLSVENGTGEVVKYRYRWAGETAWQSATLQKGEKRAHSLALKDDASPPELEAQFDGIKSAQRLKARKWTGTGEPTSDDAKPNQYRLRPR